MGHDVFISHSSRDQAAAQRLCTDLEAAGITCWIATRDVPPGENYQASIVAALEEARVFVLLFSEHSNESAEVHKEVSLASAFKAAVMPVRLAEVRPQRALMYELATRQWIDAFADWDLAMVRLAARIRATLTGSPVVEPAPAPRVVVAESPRPISVNFPPEHIEAVTRLLANYLGPIASTVVRRAARKSLSVEALHNAVVGELDRPEQRAALERDLLRLVAHRAGWV